MEYRYHIRQFVWNKDTNSFYAEAPFLEAVMPDGNFHPEAFPNMKGEFIIDNPKTGGFRRFRFLKEETESFVDEIDNEFQFTQWIFESEDGIKCKIGID